MNRASLHTSSFRHINVFCFQIQMNLKLFYQPEKFVGAFEKWGPESIQILQMIKKIVNLKQVHTQKSQGSGQWPLTNQHSMQEKLQYLKSVSCYRALQIRNFPLMSNSSLHSFTIIIYIDSHIVIYYIDTSDLPENTSLAIFIRNYIQDSTGIFSISSLVNVLMISLISSLSVKLLRAQERPATLILTLTSGLRITRARQVYNRDTETGS